MTEMVTRADGDGCSGKEGFWSRVGKVFTTRSLTRRGGPSRRTYWVSDGTRTGKPGQGQGGMVAAGRGHESHNAPGLPSSEARGTPVARSARRQTARVGRTARRPGSHPAGSKGASPEAAVEAPSSGYARSRKPRRRAASPAHPSLRGGGGTSRRAAHRNARPHRPEVVRAGIPQ